MDFIDYYKILGIDKSATADEIKKAYRKMARKYHPDLNPNDKEANIRFQQVNEANEVLTDPEKRKKYDKYGKDWQHGEQYEQARNQQQQYRQPDSETYSGGFGDSDFSDFFSSMFGGARGGRQTRYRGQDYEAAITLPFRDVYQTTKQTITINNKQVRITIPAGIEDRQRIKLAGYGSPGVNGGPAGDLFITINITADHRYIRKGNDLYVKEDISLYTAVLGGTHIVETLSGKVKVNLAAGTQNGDTARIKGKGFPAYKKEGQFGDLYVQWHIILPKTLSEEQKALFEKLAKT